MRLLEYQAKSLFREYGIAVPRGYVVGDLGQARMHADEMGFPLVLKAQLRVGGRGKAGVIAICKTPEELGASYENLIKKSVQGEQVRTLLLEEFAEHAKELYLSIFLNRTKRCYSVIASPEGGVEIESVENKVVHDIDTALEGVSKEELHDISSKLGLNDNNKTSASLVEMISQLAKLVAEKEAELAEINPVAVRSDGSLLALDAKVIIDDNAMFRHEELRRYEELSSLESEAKKSGFSLVELDGDIAVIGNGAGLVMSTLDMLNEQGGKPACFLDVGGTATTETVYKALTLISKMPRIRSILVNLFGGIVRTSVVAQAIVNAYKDRTLDVPVFARITGAESDWAREILKGSTAQMFDSVEDAISAAIRSLTS